MAKAKAIVVVESPTKVKTINKILGNKFKVVSSMGHLVDLPKSTLGVDLENGFAAKLIVVRAKQKHLTKLKKESKAAKEIYFATDPDREGEAIGWNLKEHLGEGKKIYRVTFQEITKEAVLKAFESPREFDEKKITAQVARRVLDRIVGYGISPILWKKVGSRLSAGRVQSVALRLIVEREKEIKKFVPEEFWQIGVDLKKTGVEGILTVALEKVDGKKFEMKMKAGAEKIAEELRSSSYVVSKITERQVKRKPSAPYITSTLQQDAFNKLRFNANKTMMIAQQLYEGIDVGDGETTGLITYMRTDSVNLSNDAVSKVRHFIEKEYSKEYLPKEPNVYKSKKSAQEAHEAIRASDVNLRPKDVAQFLTEDQYKLYTLIWNRFVSCQMVPAIFKNRKIQVTAGQCQLGVSGSTLVFDGCQVVDYEAKEAEEGKADLINFEEQDVLELKEVRPTQHFTKPPPRYSDASLVKDLEEDGIGRPSTYAAIIQTLTFRHYILREKGYLSPTELGIKICDLLVEYFKIIMDVKFTAQMEQELDLVEEGTLEYEKLLKDFYIPFKKELDFAEDNIEKTENFIDRNCPECERRMVVKWGRRGKFLSCSGFPECKHAEPFTTGVKCPEMDCEGELVLRSSTRGRFYGCSKYPTCTYISKELPEDKGLSS